ncbi:MAG: ABC transporter ATP-binding protein [Verrucomicrobiales bacterium]
MKRLFPFFREDLAKALLALGLLLVTIAANVAKPWPIAVIVDSVLGGKELPQVVRDYLPFQNPNSLILALAVIIFLLHSIQGITSACQNYMVIQIGLRGLRRARMALFKALERLSLKFFFGQNQGDLIYRATWDSYGVQTLLQQGFFTSLNAGLLLGFMLLIMFKVNTTLTLAALTIFPPLLLTMWGFGKGMKKRSLASHQADSGVASIYQQTITAIHLIQSYTQEKTELKRFVQQADASLAKKKSQHGYELIYWLFIAVLFGAGTALMAWIGANEVLKGRLSVGELIVFLSYLSQLYEPLNQISQIRGTVANANASVDRVFEILHSREQVHEAEKPVRIQLAGASEQKPGAVPIVGNLRFDSVQFSYTREKQVLRNLSCSIPAGSTTAIIGPSGSGKTTLLQLVPRFYDPDGGIVTLDGRDLRGYRLKDLRQNIALVLQEPLLLPATIAENIGYGKAGATMDEIKAAAQAANAEGFILQQTNGYETLIGEGNARLSVGEKQRINLARAFLKNAPILLLDEPTSALDAESEALVVEGLTKLIKGRTTLMVAHRLSTLSSVDRVIVINEGQVAEEGTREELLRSNGYFAMAMSRNTARVH